jgi:hypothetical protein
MLVATRAGLGQGMGSAAMDVAASPLAPLVITNNPAVRDLEGGAAPLLCIIYRGVVETGL